MLLVRPAGSLIVDAYQSEPKPSTADGPVISSDVKPGRLRTNGLPLAPFRYVDRRSVRVDYDGAFNKKARSQRTEGSIGGVADLFKSERRPPEREPGL